MSEFSFKQAFKHLNSQLQIISRKSTSITYWVPFYPTYFAFFLSPILRLLIICCPFVCIFEIFVFSSGTLKKHRIRSSYFGRPKKQSASSTSNLVIFLSFYFQISGGVFFFRSASLHRKQAHGHLQDSK